MTDIGTWFTQLLAPLGTLGLLICIFILFYIDAIVFPTVPELFTLVIFIGDPSKATFIFGIEILITIAIAEFLGLATLYLVVKKLRMPKKIENAINRYTRFLIVKDEKIILLNRVAPVLPFMGAFAAICNWSFKKCAIYTFIGGMVKYSLILAMGPVLYVYMDNGTANVVAVIMVLAIIVVGFVISYFKKDKILGPQGPDVAPTCSVDEKKH